MSDVPRRALLGGACVVAAACLPRARVNAACRWTGDPTALAPPGAAARRAHLVEDVRIAEDLGIRYADATVGRPPPSIASWGSARRACVEASLAEVARGHHVGRDEAAAVTGAREPWVDLLAVFAPMAFALVFAGRAVVGRLVAGYPTGERAGAAAILTLWAPLVAALALAVAQVWGVMVEMMRLGNGHISSRAFSLPASRHGWLVWGAAVALFAAVAAACLARTPGATRWRRPTLR